MSNSNRITRESMDSIIEEIMGISDCDCEIANILYNLSTDMDADDYADIYDIEVQEIEKSIYKLKESHDILYPVLVSIAETHKDMFDFCKDQN